MGRGALLFTVLLFLAAHVALGGYFVLDKSPGTDAAWSGFPLDDAWIHMVYARSIAQDGLPFYNEGELENGFTSPLWMLAAAVPHLAERVAGFSAVAGVKLLGVLFGWLASCAMMFLVLGALRDRSAEGSAVPLISAACGGLALAATPALIFTEVSGMEGALAAFLALGAFAAFGRRTFLTAGIFAGLALLARPEGALVVVFLPALFIVERLIARRRAGLAAAPEGWAAQIVRLAAPGVILAGLWVIYSLLATGRPLPNTFYAKIETSWLVGGATGASIWDMVAGLFDFGATLRVARAVAEKAHSAVLAAAALLCVTAVYRIATLRRSRVFAAGTALFGLLFVHAICVSRDMPEWSARHFYMWRYFVPAIPFLWFIAIAGLDGLLAFGGEIVMRSAARAAGALLFGVVAAGVAAGAGAAAERYAWNCQNINEVQVAMGKWVAANVPAGEAVAVNDAGAIRYFGGRPTIDLYGLNRHAGIGEMEEGVAFPMLDLPEKARWLHNNKVKYLIVFPSWLRDIAVSSMRGAAVPAAGDGPPLQARFEKVYERTSPNYTVLDQPPPGVIGQNVKHAYEVVYQVE